MSSITQLYAVFSGYSLHQITTTSQGAEKEARRLFNGKVLGPFYPDTDVMEAQEWVPN